MGVIDVHAAKTQLSRLLDAAGAGKEVILARAGKPVAQAMTEPLLLYTADRRLGLYSALVHII
jgi:hypothetical protein